MILSDNVVAPLTLNPSQRSTPLVHTTGTGPEALCHPASWHATEQERERERERERESSTNAAPKLPQHGHSVREKLYTAGGTRYSRCTLGDQESSPPTPMCAWSRCR